jgi:hypothetical protein
MSRKFRAGGFQPSCSFFFLSVMALMYFAFVNVEMIKAVVS